MHTLLASRPRPRRRARSERALMQLVAMLRALYTAHYLVQLLFEDYLKKCIYCLMYLA